VGVFPAGGWWKDHLKTGAGTEIPYSVRITIDVGDLDLNLELDVYSLVSARIPTELSVDAT
jgi:LEA14-like dessication related protein